MRSLRGALTERETLASMKTMVETYEEIAAIRMRKVKKSVLTNREFMSGLNDIYQHVALSYKSSVVTKQKHSKEVYQTHMQTNGKTVFVLLSANSGFYGSIVIDTFRDFIDDVRQSPSDIVIVGKLGKQLFEAAHVGREYVYFDYSDTGFDEDSFKKIIAHVAAYTHIIVYHGFFKSILSQIAKKTLVTGEAEEYTKKEITKAQEKGRKEISIFEPSLEEIAAFFDKQILASVFQQSVFESSLSKFASRMVSLDYVTVNITDKLKRSNFNIRKLKHNMLNKSQLSRLSSISLWKGSEGY